MNPASFVWANLRRRPVQGLLLLAAITVAFVLYGLALGIAEGFRLAALAHGVSAQPNFLAAAIGVSALGMALILLLTINAMAHVVRGRVRELAVLSAIGFSRRRIFALLVAEAAVPCLAGAALGLLCAQGMFTGLVVALPALTVVPAPVYTMPMIAGALALALLIATLGTVIPVARIARTDVAELLRNGLPAPVLAREPARERSENSSRSPDSSSSGPPQPVGAIDLLLLRQIAVATRIGLLTLPLRFKGALLIVASVGIVVFALLTPLTIAESIRVGMLSGTDPARVVLRSASGILLDNSRVPDDVAALVADAPGVARSADGRPLVDAEVFTWPRGLIKRNDGEKGYTMLVGVGPTWRAMTPQLRLLSGRMPRPGSREVIAGEIAALEFSSLDAGTMQHADVAWRIVGTFKTGSWWDGYLVGSSADIKAVATAAMGSAVRVRLTSPQAFETFRNAVAARLPPSIVVERETDYYAGLWHRVPKHLVYITLVLAALISAGAALGTTLVMHNAVEDRRQEIATLRLLGFDARAVAASVLMEGLCLAVLGSLLGLALVWACFDGRLANGAWNVSRLTVDFELLCVAVGWGAGIAIAGTLPLAIRTLRQSALDAIRDLFIALRAAFAMPARRRQA